MDPEAKAIADIIEVLSSLESDGIQRVLKFVANRYQVKQSAPVISGQPTGEANSPASSFREFYELYDTVKPETGIDKVLLAAYWYQVVLGHEELDSFVINKELKNLGHPSSNITRDLDVLINKTPRLMGPGRKEGGRRRYRLTREGILAVERMLNARQDANSNSVSV